MSEKETYDTSNPSDVKKKKSKAKRAEDQKAEVWRAVLETKAGREVLWDLLSEFGIYKTSFSVDPAVTAFNEGRRGAGLVVLDRVFTYSASAYMLMQNENRAELNGDIEI
jgi:hypothetical protein